MGEGFWRGWRGGWGGGGRGGRSGHRGGGKEDRLVGVEGVRRGGRPRRWEAGVGRGCSYEGRFGGLGAGTLVMLELEGFLLTECGGWGGKSGLKVVVEDTSASGSKTAGVRRDSVCDAGDRSGACRGEPCAAVLVIGSYFQDAVGVEYRDVDGGDGDGDGPSWLDEYWYVVEAAALGACACSGLVCVCLLCYLNAAKKRRGGGAATRRPQEARSREARSHGRGELARRSREGGSSRLARTSPLQSVDRAAQ